MATNSHVSYDDALCTLRNFVRDVYDEERWTEHIALSTPDLLANEHERLQRRILLPVRDKNCSQLKALTWLTTVTEERMVVTE